MANADLFYREIGQGQPIIIIHGGPEFDHTYLLPDMDRLSDSYRLIYYDQRGRGKSAGDARNITLRTELEDLDSLREYFKLDSVAVLGHSWGGELALEYAILYPDRVSHLILMNTCVATYEDFMLIWQERSRRLAVSEDKLKALESTDKYVQGDPEVVREYYRIVFSSLIKQPERLNKLTVSFASLTRESVLRAREIEDRLFGATWLTREFNLFPKLQKLRNPALIIHGDYDFIPVACAARVAEAIPGARIVVLRECGHFAYLEAPDEVRKVIAEFFESLR